MLLGRPHAALVQFDSAAALFGSPATELARWEWRALGPSLGLPVADTSAHTEAVRQLSRLADGPLGSRGGLGACDGSAGAGETPSPRFGGKRASSRQRPLRQRPRWVRSGERCRRLREGISIPRSRGRLLLRIDASGLVRDPFARAVLYLHRGDWLLALGDSTAAQRAWLWSDAWDVEGWPQGGAQAGEVDAALSALARPGAPGSRSREALMMRRAASSAACGSFGPMPNCCLPHSRGSRLTPEDLPVGTSRPRPGTPPWPRHAGGSGTRVPGPTPPRTGSPRRRARVRAAPAAPPTR